MSNFDITKLNTSSFKSVPFYTQSTDHSGGKRLTDHSFIDGGTKTEENGLKNNTFKIKAYLGGSNYLEEKQNLKNAFESTGPGTLIDKFWSTQEVYVDTFTFKEEKTKFGQVTIDVVFRKAENRLQQQTLLVYNEDIQTEAIANFENNYISSLGPEAMNKVALQITNVLEQVENTVKFLEDTRNELNNIKSTIGKTISTIKSTVLITKNLSNEIIDIATSFDDVLNFESFGAKDQKAFTNQIKTTLENTTKATYTNKVEQSAANQTKAFTIALNSLLMQTAIKKLETIDFNTGDEFGTVKEDVLSMFDTLEEEIKTNEDDNITNIQIRQATLEAYQKSKKEFTKFYTQKYSGLQTLKQNNLVATTDLLTLTMNKYNNITRVNEVIENNDIIDPIFVNGDLQLLDR